MLLGSLKRRKFHYDGHVAKVVCCFSVIKLFSLAQRAATKPFTFPLGASSSICLTGDHYLHCALLHQFSPSSLPQLNLCARAKQFSSFILLAGKITGPDSFDPSAALIIRDKDELNIPLNTTIIPNAREFAVYIA